MKKPKGPKAFIAKVPIGRLMKAERVDFLAPESVKILIEIFAAMGADVTKEDVKLVKTDKPKRVTTADIAAAACV